MIRLDAKRCAVRAPSVLFESDRLQRRAVILDHGEHIAVGGVRGRPLGDRAQEYGFRIGLALVMMLMIFATWNDLMHLRVFESIGSLFG